MEQLTKVMNKLGYELGQYVVFMIMTYFILLFFGESLNIVYIVLYSFVFIIFEYFIYRKFIK